MFRKTVICIPAYNPPSSLPSYANELFNSGWDNIIIVDDGSLPENQQIFKQLEEYPFCHVLHHPNNMGKGCAIKTAMEYYIKNYQNRYMGFITVDADGQHSITDVIHMDDFFQKQITSSNISSFLSSGTPQSL